MVAPDWFVSEARYLLRSYGWSDEFNLFRINHKPSPIFAATAEIGKDHRGLKQVRPKRCGQRESEGWKKRIERERGRKSKKKKPKRKKKKRKKEVRNKKETMAGGSSRHGRDGTADGGGGGGGGGDGRGEETLPGAKKYFQPLAFNY